MQLKFRVDSQHATQRGMGGVRGVLIMLNSGGCLRAPLF